MSPQARGPSWPSPFSPPDGGNLPGATASSRYVGATTAGAPVSGTFAKGDWIIDQTGLLWVCVTAGTPGTWQVASAGFTLGYAELASSVAHTGNTNSVAFSAASTPQNDTKCTFPCPPGDFWVRAGAANLAVNATTLGQAILYDGTSTHDIFSWLPDSANRANGVKLMSSKLNAAKLGVAVGATLNFWIQIKTFTGTNTVTVTATATAPIFVHALTC